MTKVTHLLMLCLAQTSLVPRGSSLGQAGGQGSLTKPTSTAIAVKKLVFRQNDHLTGINASPIFAVPFQCTSDASVFVEMLDPKNPLNPNVYSIKDGKTYEFSWSSIGDLKQPQMIGYFAGNRQVSFLLQAAPSSQVSGASSDTASSDRSFFIVSFKSNGELERVKKLNTDVSILRFAQLSSGKILIASYDAVNREPRLLLLDENGDIVRAYDQPTTSTERASVKRDSGIAGASGMALAGKTYFIPYKEDVLVWRMGTTDSLLDISPEGTAREIDLEVPRGYLVADLVPSDSGLLVHAEPVGIDTNAAIDTNSFRYLEMSVSDGSLLGELSVDGVVGSLACKSKGRYYGFTYDGKNGLLQYSAQ